MPPRFFFAREADLVSVIRRLSCGRLVGEVCKIDAIFGEPDLIFGSRSLEIREVKTILQGAEAITSKCCAWCIHCSTNSLRPGMQVQYFEKTDETNIMATAAGECYLREHQVIPIFNVWEPTICASFKRKALVSLELEIQ